MSEFSFDTISMIFNLEPHVFFVILGLAISTLVAVVLIIVFALRANRNNNNVSTKKAPRIKVVNGVRYSANNSNIEIFGEVNVTHNRGDFSVKKGQVYTASRKGTLLPGKYTVLTTAESEDKFNIRMGRYMREYSHGDTVVIPEGETFICTSHSVLLR